MFKRIVFIALMLLISTDGLALNLEKLTGAAGDALTAATLSNQQVAELGKQSADELDKQNQIAPTSNAYVTRLNRIMGKLTSVDGLKLNYKVYITKDVNAFALPDGSIRVYTGLMDLMEDNEIFFVLGHEIGHVKNGDSSDKYRLAYSASAARKTISAMGGKAAALSDSQLGELGETVVNAQFSQKQESDADLYGFKLMEKNKRDTKFAVSALLKLAALGGESSFAEKLLSSHPDSKARAARLETLRKK
ncbi:MAG: M48 family metallopeptidase [Deltaproteobacteria bacterium]|nr:M48 family metallopeptidase [Deltaproteobacteria bacterium]